MKVLLDIFSRAIVGHTVATTESDVVAERLIDTTARRQGIDRDQLVLHSDRGPQMTSMTFAELLEDLGITRSLSRPRVSNDNPFSESQFKATKYRPDYPDRSEDLAHTRAGSPDPCLGTTRSTTTPAWDYTILPTFTTAPPPVVANKQAAADRFGISWRAVNHACARLAEEALGRVDLLDGLVAVAIGEVRYEKGQRYLRWCATL